MKAVEFKKELKIRQDYPKPTPGKEEALIKITKAGICNTDLEITKGYMGYEGIIGHEFVGIVEEASSEYTNLIGKRVVGEINLACNNCEYCHKGMQIHCPNRTVLGIVNKNGCMAEYITMPVENLHVVPDNISDNEAVFTEPLAAAFEIIDQVHFKSTDNVIVLGDGKLGILIALALNLTQANIMLVGKHQNKLEIANAQGVKTCQLSELQIEKKYDVVVEATGTISGFEYAQKLTKPRGKIVLKSTVAGGKSLNLSPIVVDEITIIGSRCGPFTPALKAMHQKLIDVKPLISKEFEFDDFQKALEYSQNRDSLKVLINF